MRKITIPHQDEKDNNPTIEINEEANVNYITSTRSVLERYISNNETKPEDSQI